MQQTIDDLQTLLTGNGYHCKRLLDVIVATKVATTNYKNAAGEKNLEILLGFDKAADCVAVEIQHAFDLHKAAHREATLACLMAASARTPLLRPALDPTDGEIRLRIDCTCGSDGARDEDVLRAVALLPSFADAWYEQITAAMEKGKFDATKVATLDYAGMARGRHNASSTAAPGNEPASPATEAPSAPPVAADAGTTDGVAAARPADDADQAARIAALTTRPGAHHNRLRALLEFRRWLDSHGSSGPGPANLN